MNLYTRKKMWVLVMLLAYAGKITVNGLANALPIGGMTTGEVSAMFPNLFTPAGWTFSIWGLIYLWLAVFVIYQWKLAGRQEYRDSGKSPGPYFLVVSLANIGWIFSWHNLLIEVALACIVAMLLGLAGLYLHLDIDYRRPEPGKWTRLLLYAPVSVYLGWITVATVANVTVLLVSRGWQPLFSESTWTVIVVAVALLINLWALSRRGDVYFSAVGFWAFSGILAARWAENGSAYPLLIGFLALSVVILLTVIIFRRRSFTGV